MKAQAESIHSFAELSLEFIQTYDLCIQLKENSHFQVSKYMNETLKDYVTLRVR